jgi:hypothetical protein
MEYPEFKAYKPKRDEEAPLCNAYEDEEGDVFFVEPGFYTLLRGYEEKSPYASAILDEIDKTVKKDHKVIFTADFEHPFVEKEGFIYVEMQDITDRLGLTWVDDSRPSDYGD